MTIQELEQQLQDTLDKLDDAGIDDASRRKLKILILQLQNEILTESFNTLKDMDDVSVVDTSQINGLVAQVETEIANEKARTALVEKIIGLAKTGLRAAGVAL